MLKVVLATSNPNKVEEINAIMRDVGIEFIMPPVAFDPVENGKTFEENALIKAKEANFLTKMLTLADDSGLCVDVLNGAPGIFSARYADTPEGRIGKLLKELEHVPYQNRTARFVCAMVLLGEDGHVLFSDRGECFGKIGFDPRGENGFGYDPIFVVNGGNSTMAQLSEEEKNSISHRAKALEKLITFITQNYNQIIK